METLLIVHHARGTRSVKNWHMAQKIRLNIKILFSVMQRSILIFYVLTWFAQWQVYFIT